MSIAFKYDDIMSRPAILNEETEKLAAINVPYWVSACLSSLHGALGVDMQTAKKEELAEATKVIVGYLPCLHRDVVHEGKEFKTKLNPIKAMAEARDESEEDAPVVQGQKKFKIVYEGNFAEFDLKGSVWVGVLKGGEKESLRPFIHDVTEDGVNFKIPMLTVKLFQACISIMISMYQIEANAMPAKLLANAVRTCRNAEKRDRWLVHAHAGFNFVANYIWAKRNDKDSSFLKRMMTLSDMLYVATLFDRSQKENKDAQGNVVRFPTVQAICQTCQLSEEEAVALGKKVKSADWGAAAGSASKNVALAFVNAAFSNEKIVSSTKDDPKSSGAVNSDILNALKGFKLNP